MLIDILTLLLILNAQDTIAAKQHLLRLAANHDEDYSKLVILKAIALNQDPPAARAWMQQLY